MNTHELKYCPRCNSTFECKAGKILLCQCNKVNLNEREKEYLKNNYNDCLCIVCIEEIKMILKNASASKEV